MTGLPTPQPCLVQQVTLYVIMDYPTPIRLWIVIIKCFDILPVAPEWQEKVPRFVLTPQKRQYWTRFELQTHCLQLWLCMILPSVEVQKTRISDVWAPHLKSNEQVHCGTSTSGVNRALSMLEYIKSFLKRSHSSDHIKSRTFSSLQFYIQVAEVLHYVIQKSNRFPFFIISQKSRKYLSFSSHFMDFPWKNKISFPKAQNLCKTLSLLNHLSWLCTRNLYNSIVFGKKRFHRYFLALNPLYSPV